MGGSSARAAANRTITPEMMAVQRDRRCCILFLGAFTEVSFHGKVFTAKFSREPGTHTDATDTPHGPQRPYTRTESGGAGL